MNRDRPSPSVSVVIPTAGRAGLLKRCLSAVLADQATAEVVVVLDTDDAQTTVLVDELSRSDRRLRVTRTPPDGSGGLLSVQRARDHGATHASSEVVLAMDDDVVAQPGLVAGHARWHADRGDLVVVGYMPVATPRHWPRSHAPICFYAEAYEDSCDAYKADSGLILRGLWGGNVSVRRSRWLEAVQQPRVRSYLDDKELGLLMLRDGLEGVFDPTLRADHWYQRSLRGFVERAEKTPVAQAQLRDAYPELVEPFDREWEGGRQPGIVRLLARLAGSSAGWFAVRWGLITAISVTAALRLSRFEDVGTRVLSAVANERQLRGMACR